MRLTGSGLGCPDWPKCYGGTVPPLDTHAVIEYGNRLLTGFVGFAVIAASVLAWFRAPYRWHLALFGALLPLGVIGQAILGALVVKYHLAPGLVMCHFILSMLLLDRILDFIRGGCPRRVAGQPLLAGLEEVLRPAVIEILDNAFAAAELGDAVLAAKAIQHVALIR